MLPILEVVSIVVQIVELRRAGVQRTELEDHLVQSRKLPRYASRRLIGQVEHELKDIERKKGLPLALSPEALQADCVELKGPSRIERS